MFVCWSHSTQAAASLHSLFPQHPLVLLLLYLPDSLTLLPSHPPLILLIVPSLSLSSCASLSEYGPHRLPISLVCRRLQRLLRLADPPGRGPRAAPSSSAAPERQSQRASTAAAAAETQPRTGYPPLRAPHPCSTSSIWAVCLGPLPCHLTFPLYVGKADMSVCLYRRLQKDMFLLDLTTNPTVILFPVPNNAPCTY